MAFNLEKYRREPGTGLADLVRLVREKGKYSFRQNGQAGLTGIYPEYILAMETNG